MNRLPLLLLLCASLSVLTGQGNKNDFLPGHHGFLSTHALAIASNLSPQHHWLMFTGMTRDAEGTVHYDAYNRFGMGAFAAIRLAILPFAGNLDQQVLAARTLMNLFFVAAMVLAYFSLSRWLGNTWAAATATLLVFSSYYSLYYSDMIFNNTPVLFGCLLVFHGMVLFLQEGRFWQLAIKSCVGIFLGWQVYALLLPFTLLGCLQKTGRLRFFLLGIITLFFGIALLASNLFTEHLATNIAFRDLPTVQSMERRLGFSDVVQHEVDQVRLRWPEFTKNQLYRIGLVSLPHAIAGHEAAPWLLKLFGVGILVIALWAAGVSPLCKTGRLAVLSFALSGFCWAIPMRHYVVFHHFEGLFYLGLPLILYGTLALGLAQYSGHALKGVAGIALALFIFSSVEVQKEKAQQRPSQMAYFQDIAKQVGTGKNIFVDGDAARIGGHRHALGFYLSGNYVVSSREQADFILGTEGLEKVKPDG